MVPKENKEEAKKEEGKEEKKEEEKKEEQKEEEPQEIVLKVDMHCEACARKVAKALKGFQGDLVYYCTSLHVSHVYSLLIRFVLVNIHVLDLTYHLLKDAVVFLFIILGTGVEDVTTDTKASKVVVKGKTADPIKVCERIQKKTGRKVELISPLPKPPEENKEEPKEVKVEEKKEEVQQPLLIHHTHTHCKIIYV